MNPHTKTIENEAQQMFKLQIKNNEETELQDLNGVLPVGTYFSRSKETPMKVAEEASLVGPSEGLIRPHRDLGDLIGTAATLMVSCVLTAVLTDSDIERRPEASAGESGRPEKLLRTLDTSRDQQGLTRKAGRAQGGLSPWFP